MMEVNIDHVPAMLYVYAVNHDTGESSFPFVSDYCEKMFGFPASLVMENPKILVNCILEEEAEQYAAAVMESMEKLSPFDRLGRMRRQDGRIINVHYKSMPRLVEEMNSDGTTSTYTVWDGIVFDVTRQVANEETSRTKLQEMIDESIQPMFEIDTQGCIMDWNDPMAKVTGFQREEVIGQPVVGYMPEEERGKFTARLHDDESPCDCVFVTKEEEKRVYLHAKVTTSRDANWSNKGQLFCCQDVTIVKEVEKQKDAALKLVDAERGLTEWLSHEVRNPLSVAMEAAIALKEGGDETLSCIDLICESIHYIVDLLNNMLDLNKCLEGKIALDPTPCRVREEVLMPTLKIMGVHNSSVQLRLEDGEELIADVDKLRLRQVMTNLISNALKFTTEGFVHVSLQQQISTLTHKRSVQIAVSDSGCGVQPSNYGALFSKWEQLGSKINGTGIGLCLSRSLVKSMGGHLYLNKGYSSGIEGRPGAQFIVELPLAAVLGPDGTSVRMPAFESLSAAVKASQARRRSETGVSKEEKIDPDLSSPGLHVPVDTKQSTAGFETYVRGKFRILVVDDDVVGRKMLRRRFSRLFPEADIDVVASGEAALCSSEVTKYDIITVDHFMAVGEMSGEETIRALRAREVDALIVGISGNLKDKEHIAAGAQDFFQKPIPSDEVIVNRLVTKLSPPSSWKVLCVDDVNVNVHFLIRRLRKVAVSYFTSMRAAEERWCITSRSSGEEAIEALTNEWFDLVIVDQYLGAGCVSGADVARFVCEGSVNKNSVVVMNSGSILRLPDSNEDVPYNLFWPKPLPSTEQMRLELCRELLDSKSNVRVQNTLLLSPSRRWSGSFLVSAERPLDTLVNDACTS